MRKAKQNPPATTSHGDTQDGILAHYLKNAKLTDSNVERMIDKESFDFRELMRAPKKTRAPK